MDRDRRALALGEVVGVVHILEAARADDGVDVSAELGKWRSARFSVSGLRTTRERSAAYPVRVDDRVEASGDNGSAATEDPVLRVRDRGEGGEGEELGEHGVKTVKRARNV